MNIDDLTVIARQEAIVKRIEQLKDIDIFGEYRPRLICFLDYEHAQPFLKDGATEDDWEPDGDELLRSELHRYMEDWWKENCT